MAETRYPPCETPRCPECGAITVFQERGWGTYPIGWTDYRFACSADMCDIWTSVAVRDED